MGAINLYETSVTTQSYTASLPRKEHFKTKFIIMFLCNDTLIYVLLQHVLYTVVYKLFLSESGLSLHSCAFKVRHLTCITVYGRKVQNYLH
jgi:hypothetical protein